MCVLHLWLCVIGVIWFSTLQLVLEPRSNFWSLKKCSKLIFDSTTVFVSSRQSSRSKHSLNMMPHAPSCATSLLVHQIYFIHASHLSSDCRHVSSICATCLLTLKRPRTRASPDLTRSHALLLAIRLSNQQSSQIWVINPVSVESAIQLALSQQSG